MTSYASHLVLADIERWLFTLTRRAGTAARRVTVRMPRN